MIARSFAGSTLWKFIDQGVVKIGANILFGELITTKLSYGARRNQAEF